MPVQDFRAQVNQSVIRKGYVDLDFGQIHYRSLLTGKKPLLLLLHQSPSSSLMYVELIGHLQTHFDVLAMDTPGFGGSDKMPAPMSIKGLTRALKTAKDIIDIRPGFVFGHHTGAALAVQMAADYPEAFKALALSGPPLLDQNQRANLVSRATTFPLAEDGSHLVSMWQRIRGKDYAADLTLSLRETLLAFVAEEAYPASYQAVIDQDFSALLEQVICPAIVFAGDEDPLYNSVSPTLAHLKYGERRRVPSGCKTYICDRQAVEVSAILTKFFMSHV